MIPAALVHFDIDGTLLRPGPAPRQALGEALEASFGTQGRLVDVRFGGKTDRLIVAEALPSAPAWDDPVWASFWAVYLRRLDELLEGTPPEVLPGVRELLSALEERPDVGLGLVTGNVPGGARIKLRRAGLHAFFDPPAVAAYADDGASKAELGLALSRRSRERFGPAVGRCHQVVIGDTGADVACARAAGFRAVAVATGPFGLEELSRTRPDAVLAALEPLQEALGAIFAGAGSIG